MKKFKKSLLSAAMAATISLGSVPQANALTVIDPTLIAVTKIGFASVAAYLTSFEAWFGTIAWYLSGISGEINGMNKIQLSGQQSIIRSLDDQVVAQKMVVGGQAGIQETYRMQQQLMPSPFGCAAATTAQMKGVSAGSPLVGATIMKNIAIASYASPSEVNNFGMRLQSHFEDSEQCDETDVLRQRKNCTVAGKRAGADMLAASLFMGAGSGAATVKKNAAATQPDYSFSQEQFKTASRAINNITAGNTPPLLRQEEEGTAAGSGYLALTNIMKSRSSVAQFVISDIMSKRVGADVGGAQPSAAALKSWNAYSSVFSKIYPGRAMPSVPSEYEALKLSVMYRAGTTEYSTMLQGTAEDIGVQREIAYTLADTNHLLFSILEQQEKTNLVLATLLSQQIDPVSKDVLNTQRDAAVRSAKK